MASFAAWTGDESQKTYLHSDISGYFLSDPTPTAAPTGREVLLWRVSPVMPTPTLTNGRPQADWEPSSTVVEEWGRFQVITSGTDVTYFRNVPVTVMEYGSSEPFGDSYAILRFSQITPFEHVGSSPLSWLEKGRNIELKKIAPDNSRKVLFSGLVASTEGHLDGTSGYLDVHIRGAIFGPDFGVKQPSFDYRERDIGGPIAEAFNLYAGASHGKCIPVNTGITTRSRGSWTSNVTGFVQDLLSTATTDDGLNQWTVKQNHRTPVIALKDVTTVHCTLTTGTPGLSIDLASDLTSTANVIYGEGINPDGMRWGNTKHPRLRANGIPTFAGTNFSPGASTTGFQAFSDELRDNGYPDVVSQDTYLAADEDEVRDAQRRAGATVDGIVGPQTWTGVFQLGSNIGDLLQSYRAPLWSDPAVERYLYNAQGAKIGNNPAFDATVVRIERFLNFGEGVTLARAKTMARAIGARESDAGHSGTLTIAIDPEEMSRLEIRAGMNVLLKSYQGFDRMLHVADVRINPSESPITASLTVDTKARDKLTLDAIRLRNSEAATDTARRGVPQRRASRQAYDNRIMWDSDAGAGLVPRFALTGGLWSVVQIPAGQRGDVVRTHFVTDSSASRFALAVFGRRITPAQLVAKVGNPLAASNPWTDFSDDLIDLGIMQAWGTQDNACGYGNHYQGQTVGAGVATVNGVFDDGGSWPYESYQPPWLWVAVYAASSCYVTGHLYAAAET